MFPTPLLAVSPSYPSSVVFTRQNSCTLVKILSHPNAVVACPPPLLFRLAKCVNPLVNQMGAPFVETRKAGLQAYLRCDCMGVLLQSIGRRSKRIHLNGEASLCVDNFLRSVRRCRYTVLREYSPNMPSILTVPQ